MTSRDQIYVLETIKAMKKKIARDAIGKQTVPTEHPTSDHDDESYPSYLPANRICFVIESDSDSEIQVPTNRGQKLKHKAKFVREGKLGPPTGPAVYKEAGSIPPSRLSRPFAALTANANIFHDLLRKWNMLGTADP